MPDLNYARGYREEALLDWKTSRPFNVIYCDLIGSTRRGHYE